LDAAAGVQVLDLGRHETRVGGDDGGESNQGRVTDEVRDVVCDLHTSIVARLTPAGTPGPRADDNSTPGKVSLPLAVDHHPDHHAGPARSPWPPPPVHPVRRTC